MCPKNVDQPLCKNEVQGYVDCFLVDRRAQGVSSKTIRAYSQELRYFQDYLSKLDVISIDRLTAQTVRMYMLELENRGRNPGGRHIAYRVIKTFSRWLEEETDGNWKCPMHKVGAPKLDDKVLDPIQLKDIEAMIHSAAGIMALRDKSILYCLLDSGCRAEEFVSIDLADVDTATGQIAIRRGKGGKSRTVFIGKKSRRALRAYLKTRNDDNKALWVTDEGERLTYYGLRQIVRRLSVRAGIPTPSLHSFRRTFTLEMLRAGTDLLTIQRLLGHADLQVIRRYAKQTTEDLMTAHQAGSPVDRKMR